MLRTLRPRTPLIALGPTSPSLTHSVSALSSMRTEQFGPNVNPINLGATPVKVLRRPSLQLLSEQQLGQDLGSAKTPLGHTWAFLSLPGSKDRFLRRRAGRLQQVRTTLRRCFSRSGPCISKIFAHGSSTLCQDASTVLITKLFSDKGDVVTQARLRGTGYSVGLRGVITYTVYSIA